MSPSRSIDKVIWIRDVLTPDAIRDVPTPDAKDPPAEAGGSFHSVTESTEDPFLISACEDCLTAPAIFVHESAGLLACGVVAAHSFSTRSALDVVSLLCLAKCHRFSFPEIGMDTDCTPRRTGPESFVHIFSLFSCRSCRLALPPFYRGSLELPPGCVFEGGML